MNQIIHPVRSLSGEVLVPGDKSISHRALILGALTRGKATIHNLCPGEDVQRTSKILKNLGINIEWKGNLATINSKGISSFQEPDRTLDAGNSGTTIRLITGLLSGLPFYSQITGDTSLQRRPMKRIIEPLSLMGARIEYSPGNQFPLCIYPSTLRGIHYTLQIASAQVKSSILLAGITGGISVEIKEPVRSRDHTERMMEHLGFHLERNGFFLRFHPSGKDLLGGEISVPGDISSAAFFAAGCGLLPGSNISFSHLSINPTRDGFFKLLTHMGMQIKYRNVRIVNNEPVGDVFISGHVLKPPIVQPDEIPKIIDEIPLIAILSAVCPGTTEIRHARELRFKESDRIAVTVENLRRMGVQVEELPDGMVIHGPAELKGAELDSKGDHRIAMAFTIAALKARLDSIILDTECVTISYPGFFHQLQEVCY
jgi:3-phosphoshikimate 1-carboxyvinyltransferase